MLKLGRIYENVKREELCIERRRRK